MQAPIQKMKASDEFNSLKFFATPLTSSHPAKLNSAKITGTPIGPAWDFNDTDAYLTFPFTNTTGPMTWMYVTFPRKTYLSDGSSGCGTVFTTNPGSNGIGFSEYNAFSGGTCNRVNSLRFTIWGLAHYGLDISGIYLVTCGNPYAHAVTYTPNGSVKYYTNGTKLGEVNIGAVAVGAAGLVVGRYDSSDYFGQPTLGIFAFDKELPDPLMISLTRDPFSCLVPA
jgi:hypothetical protein